MKRLSRLAKIFAVVILCVSVTAYFGRYYLNAFSLREVEDLTGIKFPNQLQTATNLSKRQSREGAIESMAIYAEIFPDDQEDFIRRNYFRKPISIPSISEYRDHEFALGMFRDFYMQVPAPLPSSEVMISRSSNNSVEWTLYLQPSTGRLLGYIHRTGSK